MPYFLDWTIKLRTVHVPCAGRWGTDFIAHFVRKISRRIFDDSVLCHWSHHRLSHSESGKKQRSGQFLCQIVNSSLHCPLWHIPAFYLLDSKTQKALFQLIFLTLTFIINFITSLHLFIRSAKWSTMKVRTQLFCSSTKGLRKEI